MSGHAIAPGWSADSSVPHPAEVSGADAHSARQVHAAASALRADAAALCDRGGITHDNLARMQRWLDGPAWALLDDQRIELEKLTGSAAAHG